MISLIDGKFALPAHLAILIDDTMDASFTHGFGVMNMLRCKGAIFFEYHLHTQKSH